MPDENGTETTRQDAPSANDVLFGDAAEEPAAAVATEAGDLDAKDANGRPNRPNRTYRRRRTDKADAERPILAHRSELKVVVVIKGDRATIGVKGTSSDPHIESFDDPDLSGLAQEIPAVVERARARWEESPKHPAHVKPAPPAKRRNRRQQGSAAQAAPPRKRSRPSPRRRGCSRDGAGNGGGRRTTMRRPPLHGHVWGFFAFPGDVKPRILPALAVYR